MDKFRKIQLPIRRMLENGDLVELDWMLPQEQNAVREILNAIIIEGKTYPQEHPLSEQEFAASWLAYDGFVVRNISDENEPTSGEIVAAFYLKPNFPGRSSHICNAGFIVQPSWRGRGVGRFMGETMLEIAPNLGYKAVMFNLVFETNVPSLRLWKNLGFETIGRIPKAVRLSKRRMVDALILYRRLDG